MKDIKQEFSKIQELKTNVQIQAKNAIQTLFDETDFTGIDFVKEDSEGTTTVRIIQKNVEFCSYVVVIEKTKDVSVQGLAFRNEAKNASIASMADLLETVISNPKYTQYKL